MAQLKSTNVAGNLSATGSILAPKFIKLGGTSSGFLKADGSVDTTAYTTNTGTVTSISVGTGLTTSVASNGAITTSGTISLDADLAAIAALTGTSGLLKKTKANTWELDTNTYLTSHQSLENYVTLNGAQTITGIKTFSHSTFGAIVLKRDGSANASSVTFQNSNGTLGYIGMTGGANGGLLRWPADISTSYTIWDSGNDGSGSGLDADLLDGKHASEFQPVGNYVTQNTEQEIAAKKSFSLTGSTQRVEVSNTKVRLANSANGFNLQYNDGYKALEFVFA